MGYYNSVLTFTWEWDAVTSNCTVSHFHFLKHSQVGKWKNYILKLSG